MNQPYGGQYPGGGQYGQPPYGAQPPAAPRFGAQAGYPQTGYPQAQPVPAQPLQAQPPQMPGYPQQAPGYPAATPAYPGAQSGFAGQQAGYPQAQGGFGRIVLQSSYFFMAWRLNKVPMTVFVDGVPQQMRWGQTILDLPAGQHQVAVQGDYRGRRTIGQAQTVVQVMPGQHQVLYYRAPALATAPGSLGLNPQQPTNGMGVSLAISCIPLLIALIAIIVTLTTT